MADKLAEYREHRVIEPLLAGKDLSEKFNKDDMAYVLDLGLIRQPQEAALGLPGVFRERSEHTVEPFQYKEARPHLLFQGFF